MIVGLTGYAQSGKDTVAKVLVENYGFTRVAFADKIREYLYEVNPMYDSIVGEPMFVRAKVDRDGWDDAKQHPQIRRLLQNAGVGARKLFGDAFWVAKAVEGLDWNKNYVFTDVRFTNEANLLKKWTPENTQIWRIKRVGVQAVNGHVSEHEMDGYKVDQIFANNGTIEDLELMVKTRMVAYANG
jgi:hypothetical protein